MARLVVIRGEKLVREIDLGERDLRIGRGPDNDVVLEDDEKSISRVHAEVRREGDAYTVLDLNSQNGVWVDGHRVPKAPLVAGHPVTIGAYTLTLESAAPAPPPVPGGVSQETVRMTAIRNETVAIVRSTVKPPAEGASSAPDKAVKVKGPRVDPMTWLLRLPKPLLFGGFAAVAVVGAVVASALRPAAPVEAPAEPVATAVSRNAREIEEHLSAAKDLIAAGRADAAIADHLDRVLLLDPTNEAALDLKASAERLQSSQASNSSSADTPPEPLSSPAPAPAPTPAPPPPPTPAPAPATTGASSNTGGGAGATPPARTRAPRAPAPPAPVSAPDDPPFARRPGETQTAWRARGQELQERYDDARALLARGDAAGAQRGFEAIARDEPGYLDVDTRIAEARRLQHGTAASALKTARELEQQGDLVKALAQYEHALELDPSLAEATRSLAALKTRLMGDVDEFYRRARQYDALGFRPEAIDHYERALAALGAADPRRRAAQERLSLLKTMTKKPGGSQ
ncbi:MAG: FHA domain-containing protein [Vicinamibacterales bacterium]